MAKSNKSKAYLPRVIIDDYHLYNKLTNLHIKYDIEKYSGIPHFTVHAPPKSIFRQHPHQKYVEYTLQRIKDAEIPKGLPAERVKFLKERPVVTEYEVFSDYFDMYHGRTHYVLHKGKYLRLRDIYPELKKL